MRLTDADVKKVAKQINDNFDLPFVNKVKQVWSEWLVRKINTLLLENLPPEIYSDGITSEEANIMSKRFARWVNGKVNIPLVSEEAEQVCIENIISLLVGYLTKPEPQSEQY